MVVTSRGRDRLGQQALHLGCRTAQGRAHTLPVLGVGTQEVRHLQMLDLGPGISERASDAPGEAFALALVEQSVEVTGLRVVVVVHGRVEAVHDHLAQGPRRVHVPAVGLRGAGNGVGPVLRGAAAALSGGALSVARSRSPRTATDSPGSGGGSRPGGACGCRRMTSGVPAASCRGWGRYPARMRWA